MSFFLLFNTKKEDILKKMGNQTVDGLHFLPYHGKKANGEQKMFVFYFL